MRQAYHYWQDQPGSRVLRTRITRTTPSATGHPTDWPEPSALEPKLRHRGARREKQPADQHRQSRTGGRNFPAPPDPSFSVSHPLTTARPRALTALGVANQAAAEVDTKRTRSRTQRLSGNRLRRVGRSYFVSRAHWGSNSPPAARGVVVRHGTCTP